MQRRNTVLMAVVFIVSSIITGCGGSAKGKWSEADKQKFRKDMAEVKELSNFGENKNKWIECYLKKCEAKYTSYGLADRDKEGCEKLAMECGNEVLANGSVKGNWSKADKQKFREEMLAIEELSNLGENKNKWIECFLSKCEANYASYFAANTDEAGCEKLSLQCIAEMK